MGGKVRDTRYLQVNWTSMAVVVGTTLAFLIVVFITGDPSKGMIGRRRGPGAG